MRRYLVKQSAAYDCINGACINSENTIYPAFIKYYLIAKQHVELDVLVSVLVMVIGHKLRDCPSN